MVFFFGFCITEVDTNGGALVPLMRILVFVKKKLVAVADPEIFFSGG
jgi:hypothetical protein